jgi:hypothetical protein
LARSFSCANDALDDVKDELRNPELLNQELSKGTLNYIILRHMLGYKDTCRDIKTHALLINPEIQ